MKKFFNEFKEFIARGNVMDIAIGMVLGSAFTAIVTGLVEGIIMPVISVITGGISFESWVVPLGAGEAAPVLNFGMLVTAIINFIIIGFVIFMVVKAMNKVHARKEAEKAPAPETTKECPYCKSKIDINATRCPHCTSQLEDQA